MDTVKCGKCGGLLIREVYQCEQGKCSYIKCVMCGTYTFLDKATSDTEEVESVYPSNRPSFSEIGRAMGVTKQRVGFLYLRAISKIAKIYPNLRRLR